MKDGDVGVIDMAMIDGRDDHVIDRSKEQLLEYCVSRIILFVEEGFRPVGLANGGDLSYFLVWLGGIMVLVPGFFSAMK